jgi:hypothetical protein
MVWAFQKAAGPVAAASPLNRVCELVGALLASTGLALMSERDGRRLHPS